MIEVKAKKGCPPISEQGVLTVKGLQVAANGRVEPVFIVSASDPDAIEAVVAYLNRKLRRGLKAVDSNRLTVLMAEMRAWKQPTPAPKLVLADPKAIKAKQQARADKMAAPTQEG